MKILITGGRNYKNKKLLYSVLDYINEQTPIESLAHGDCTGADLLAKEWCLAKSIKSTAYPADWSIGKKAGPMRNAYMLKDFEPDMVLAFDGGRGTANAIQFAKKMGFPVTFANEVADQISTND
jgi:hypothetical protein